MVDGEFWGALQIRHRLPRDLVGLTILLLIADISILAPVIRETPLRVPFGFLLLLFIPGYALTVVIFPEHAGAASQESEESPDAVTPTSQNRGLDGVERVTISIALSLVLVMLTALVLHHSGIGIRVEPALGLLNVIVVGTTVAGAVRRRRVSPNRRAGLRVQPWLAGLRAEIDSFDSIDRALSVLLVASLLFVGAGTAYTVVVPGDDETFTEFYLLDENETGALQATDYPTTFTVDESKSLTVGITNQEYETVEYTVLVKLQRVERRAVSAPIIEERELHRFNATLEHGETWRKRHTITPRQTGTNLRVRYLLYRGTPPDSPTRANAYRRLYFWINVSEPSERVTRR